MADNTHEKFEGKTIWRDGISYFIRENGKKVFLHCTRQETCWTYRRRTPLDDVLKVLVDRNPAIVEDLTKYHIAMGGNGSTNARGSWTDNYRVIAPRVDAYLRALFNVKVITSEQRDVLYQWIIHDIK